VGSKIEGVRWQLFPKSLSCPQHLLEVVNVFANHFNEISSIGGVTLKSNKVLEIISTDLINLNFKVEKSRKDEEKISVPVLFGENGAVEKKFLADAVHEAFGVVIEVEAGRAIINNQFLKDLFQACVMPCTDYLVIALRQEYKVQNKGRTIIQKDYDIALTFLDTLYASGRLTLPLKGVMLLGY
jgi:hypothetical protein